MFKFKLLNCYIVILLIGVGGFLLVGLKGIKAEQCSSGTCYPALSCPDGQEEVGTCNYSVGGGINVGKCCKSKGGSGGALLQSSGKAKYSSGCISEGDCTLNDFVVVMVRASELILGVTGSLALAFFIYGGIMFMVSGGNSDRVNQAKQILIGAVIGLIIVFTSYMIINFIVKDALGIQKDWFKSEWF